jgi:hypothetical protein
MGHATWLIESGSLKGRSHAPNWRDAFLEVVRRKRPKNLARLVRARYICCSYRDHASHYVYLYFDPLPCLRYAGLLAKRAGVEGSLLRRSPREAERPVRGA